MSFVHFHELGMELYTHSTAYSTENSVLFDQTAKIESHFYPKLDQKGKVTVLISNKKTVQAALNMQCKK